MTHAKTPLTHTFKVGTKYTCEMTMRDGPKGHMMHVSWDPYRPNGMTKREDRDYFRGRHEFLTAYSAATGKRVAVLDV